MRGVWGKGKKEKGKGKVLVRLRLGIKDSKYLRNIREKKDRGREAKLK